MSKEETAVNLPENVRDIAKIFKSNMKLGDNGVVEVAEDAFEKTLEGTGLDMATFKKAHTHRDDTLAGLGLALGELGIDAMKKDKKLEQVSAEIKVHKDVMGAVFSRSRSYPSSDGGTATTYGSLNAKYTANGAVNRGSLKKVKTHLTEMAKEVLAK